MERIQRKRKGKGWTREKRWGKNGRGWIRREEFDRDGDGNGGRVRIG